MLPSGQDKHVFCVATYSGAFIILWRREPPASINAPSATCLLICNILSNISTRTTISDIKDADPYLKHIKYRKLKSDITDEWKAVFNKPGRPQRVHGDGKSRFDGKWTLWVDYTPLSKSKVNKPVVHLCNPDGENNEHFNENHVLFTAEVDGINDDVLGDRETCEEYTKRAVLEGYTVSHHRRAVLMGLTINYEALTGKNIK